MSSPEYWFIFQQDQLLCVHRDDSMLPSSADIASLRPHLSREYPLGLFNQVHCYCAEVNTATVLPTFFYTMPLRKAFIQLGEDWFIVAAKARSILTWDKNHHYCGACANITVPQPGTFERKCSVCGMVFYPRISPAIIVRIQKDDQILLTRSHHFMPGAYGLIAGFVEAGESVEHAVYREVQEEVALKIKNLKYYGSQAWPFPDSLMLAFTAEYLTGEIKIQSSEIETAGWFCYNNLPGLPSSSISIARILIDDFILQQTMKRASPPIKHKHE